MLRTSLSILPRRSIGATRTLHSSPVARKTVTEKVKEAANTVNLKVGQKLAKGIEKGEVVTEKTQQAAGTVKGKAEETAGSAKSQADQTGEAAKQKANEAASGAREAKDDVKKQMHD